MTRQVEAAGGGRAPDKDRPHVFQEVDLLSMAKPQGHIVMGPYTPPPMPAGKSVVCGICKRPRTDRIHIEGEAQADTESPRSGL